MRFVILLLVFVFSLLNVFSQSEKITFHNLSTSMGLSHGDVTSFCQDHDSFFWIGTADGLSKYDGIQFTVFRNDRKDSTSIPYNYINYVYEDKQNSLWVALTTGLCRYNRDNNNFERIPMIDNQNKPIDNQIDQMFEDKNGRLWIGCNLGIYLFNREDMRFYPYFINQHDSYLVNQCTGIGQDKAGALWFAFLHNEEVGLIKFNPETRDTIRYSVSDPLHKLKENEVNSLMIDDQDNIWIGYYSKGIDVLNKQGKLIASYKNINNDESRSNNNITSMVQNKDGKIFIGTNGSGLKIFDPNTNTFKSYSASDGDNSIISNSVQSISVTNEGMVCIACWGGGVSCYDKRFERFIHYKQGSENVNSLHGSSVTCFTEDKNGNIWISTDGGGINKFNPRTQKFTNFRSKINDLQTLTNDKVLAIQSDHKGGLWAGMWQGGLNYFKIEGESLVLKKKYDYVDPDNLVSNSIYNIHNTVDDELWVGNFETGLYKFNSSSEKFESIKLSEVPTTYNSIRDITLDSKNNLWISSEVSGVIKMNRKSGETESFIPIENDSTSLINSSINIIFEDSKKRLWLGSDGGGLNLFNPDNKSFTHYLYEDGLPDNSVQGILEDAQGNLWISTFNGISKVTIDPAGYVNGKLKLKFKNFTVQDGLQGSVYNRWAYFKSSSGEMYFGGLNGFNVFSPANIKDNSYIPPIHFTDFLLFNKPVAIGEKGSPLSKHISQTKEIVLGHDQSFITLRYVALNFIFSEKNQYAYKLEGFDKDWNYVGFIRGATYTNLDPGKYTFRVKASNNDGIWNEEGISLKITILPPWWETWWFRFIVILFVIFSLWGIYYLRLLNYRSHEKQLTNLVNQRTVELQETNILLTEKNELLDEANSSKDKFFSIIAHDLKNPFGTIMGLSALLVDNEYKFDEKQQKDIIRNINTSTEKVYNLLETLLLWSRSQLNRIEVNPVSYNLTNQIHEVILLLRDFSKAKDISLIFDKKEELLVWADQPTVDIVLRNLITNAVKFSANGENVSIELIEKEGQAVCSVIDHGKGMTKEQVSNLFKIDKVTSTSGTQGEKGSGLGLNLCWDFLEKNNGSIWVESTPDRGSTFYFSLPTTQE